MSVEAIAWVLNEAPDVPPQLVGTLVGLANHASPDGRNAYPSQARLAKYTRKSERQVRRDLSDLAARGLIRRGNQRIVEHLPIDRRPVVYNLAMDLDGGTSTSARSSTSPRTSVSERGDVDDRNGGTSTSAKPSSEPSITVSHARAREAIRWLHTRYGLTDDEAQQVIDQVKARAAGPIAHLVPYMDHMTEGHLADIVAAVMRPAPTEPPLKVVPDWCGICNEDTRQAGDPDRPSRCPSCHPLRDQEIA